MILFIFGTLIYVMVVHSIFVWINSRGSTPKEKLADIMAHEGNPRNITNDYISPAYDTIFWDTVLSFLNILGYEGELGLSDNGNPTFKPINGSEEPSKTIKIVAGIFSSFRIIIFPFTLEVKS